MNAHETKYDTLVVEGMDGDVPRVIGELRVAAWSAGHALNEKLAMEDFIRELSYGDIEEPQQAATDLMERMKWA